MDRKIFLEYLASALSTITTPRFYETERGFQGELVARLQAVIPEGFLPDQAIVEQEYQKRLKMHGLAIRPDLIIHVPFNPALHNSRRDGNVAVIELKRAATAKSAAADIESLIQMMEILEYPLAIFINIDSDITYAEVVPAKWRERIVCIAVSLQNGEPNVLQAKIV